MDATVKAKALDVLDGMAEMVARDRLKHGVYATVRVDPEFVDHVCRGRRHCLIGSMWAAHGDPEYHDEHYYPDGVGTRMAGTGDVDSREAWMATRPALRLVYETMNAAALCRAPLDEIGALRGDAEFNYGGSEAEAFFETLDPAPWEIEALIADTRREIEAL